MASASTFDANNADTREIARWLETALDGYIKDDMGRWAFRPLERYIGVRDDLVDDLRAIYDSLTASAQGRWRDAIRDMLAIHGRDISKRKTTRVLLTFATVIRSHEVLDVLPSILSGSQDDDLLDITVEAATSLASQTEASRRCLDRIRTSPAFTSHYAGLILVALCHADPDNWLHHVKELGVAMGKLASRLDPDSTALRFYASNILNAIGLSRITTASLAALSTRPGHQFLWLLKEWFQDDQSLLRLRPTTVGVGIALRTDDSVSTELHDWLDTEVLQADRQQGCPRTTVAWECDGSHKPRVAVCNGDDLTTITSVEASREALVTAIDRYLGQRVIRWPTPFPMQRGVASVADGETPKVSAGKELHALENRAFGRKYTERVRYWSKRSQNIDHSLRRIAINDHRASKVAALALDARGVA